MFGVGAIKFHLSLQWHTVGKSALQTFVYGVARRVNEIVKELEHEVVAGVCNREILSKHLVQSVVLTFLRWCVQL